MDTISQQPRQPSKHQCYKSHLGREVGEQLHVCLRSNIIHAVAFSRTYEEKRLIGRVHTHTQSHAHTFEIIFYLMQVHSNDSTCSTDLKLSNVRYPVVVT